MRSLYRLLYHLLYNHLAWAYDPVSWIVSLGRWDSWRRAALPFVRGERILEVGFGTGELLTVLQSGQRQVIGIEPSAAMQNITMQKLGKRAQTTPRLQGIAQRLPFANDLFDSIVCTFPASFILDPRAHQEFARCLRPGGRLIVVEVALTAGESNCLAAEGPASPARWDRVPPEPLLRLLFHLLFPSTPAAFTKLRDGFQTAGLTRTEHLIGHGPVRALVIVAEKQAHR